MGGVRRQSSASEDRLLLAEQCKSRAAKAFKEGRAPGCFKQSLKGGARRDAASSFACRLPLCFGSVSEAGLLSWDAGSKARVQPAGSRLLLMGRRLPSNSAISASSTVRPVRDPENSREMR